MNGGARLGLVIIASLTPIPETALAFSQTEDEPVDQEAYQLLKRGRYREAVERYNAFLRIPEHLSVVPQQGGAIDLYRMVGKRTDYGKVNAAAYYNIACAYSLGGEPEKALLPFLESYYREPERRRDRIRSDRRLERLRASPYYAIAERILDLPLNDVRMLDSLAKLVQSNWQKARIQAQGEIDRLSDVEKKRLVFVLFPYFFRGDYTVFHPGEVGVTVDDWPAPLLENLRTEEGEPLFPRAYQDTDKWDNTIKDLLYHLFLTGAFPDVWAMDNLLPWIERSESAKWIYQEFIKILESRDDDLSRVSLVERLPRYRRTALEVVPVLARLLRKDESCRVRTAAVRKLGEVALLWKLGIPALKSALADKERCYLGDMFPDEWGDDISVAQRAAAVLNELGILSTDAGY